MWCCVLLLALCCVLLLVCFAALFVNTVSMFFFVSSTRPSSNHIDCMQSCSLKGYTASQVKALGDRVVLVLVPPKTEQVDVTPDGTSAARKKGKKKAKTHVLTPEAVTPVVPDQQPILGAPAIPTAVGLEDAEVEETPQPAQKKQRALEFPPTCLVFCVCMPACLTVHSQGRVCMRVRICVHKCVSCN
jgi:hypothetical protein